MKYRDFLFLFISLLACAHIHAQNVNIPDTNFKNYLLGEIAINTVDDGEISTEEASAFTGTINITSMEISSLTGIEAFTSLQQLEASSNSIASVDLSANTSLLVVNLSYNDLTSLDISSNTLLQKLSLNGNSISSIDVTSNTALTDLNLQENDLSSIDISNNTALKVFTIDRNSVSSIEVSSNTLLTNLSLYENSINAIDLSQNTALNYLYISDNNLTSLDLSNNVLIEELQCANNGLTNLDVSALTQMTSLSCHNNELTTLDASGGSISHIDCGYNNLTSLDLTANSQLVSLSCYYNMITSLDVSGFAGLTWLAAENNSLTSIDVSQNPNLETFRVSENNITPSIDLSNNTSLKEVYCSKNKLETLDLRNGNNSSFTSFNIDNDSLYCVLVDDPDLFSVDYPLTNGNYTTEPCQRVTSLSVNGSGDSTLVVNGKTLQMVASIVPDDATFPEIHWGVDYDTVISIDGNGLLTAKGKGEVKVTASTRDGSDLSETITIKAVNVVSSISVTRTGVDPVNIGGTLQLTALVFPEDAYDVSVTWSSKNESIAIVDQNGLMTGVSEGTAVIKAEANDGTGVSGEISIEVKNNKVTFINIYSENNVLRLTEEGETLQMTAEVLPENAADKTVTWSVNDEEVATISVSGLVTAVGPGIVEIKASANDDSGVSNIFNLPVDIQVLGTIETNSLQLYPNPVSELLNLGFADKPEPRTYEILNMAGQVEMQGKNESTINVHSLAPGVYFLKIHTGKESKLLEFIKN